MACVPLLAQPAAGAEKRKTHPGAQGSGATPGYNIQQVVVGRFIFWGPKWWLGFHLASLKPHKRVIPFKKKRMFSLLIWSSLEREQLSMFQRCPNLPIGHTNNSGFTMATKPWNLDVWTAQACPNPNRAMAKSDPSSHWTPSSKGVFHCTALEDCMRILGISPAVQRELSGYGSSICGADLSDRSLGHLVHQLPLTLWFKGHFQAWVLEVMK